MDLHLIDKVFIVSGGASGLGGAVAAGLVGEGARVVVCSRSAERVRVVVNALGDRATGFAADLLDRETPGRLIDHARQTFGGLDGAFVSHGGPPPGPAADLDDEQLRVALEVAAVAPIRLIREIVRELSPGGAVLALTSSTAPEPMPGMAGSNVARAAVHGYVKTLAAEVAARGIRVNALVPGSFATARLEQLRGRGSAYSEAATRQAPLGGPADPDDLVATACLLLSSRSGYVTGAAWTVDGGRRSTM